MNSPTILNSFLRKIKEKKFLGALVGEISRGDSFECPFKDTIAMCKQGLLLCTLFVT